MHALLTRENQHLRGALLTRDDQHPRGAGTYKHANAMNPECHSALRRMAFPTSPPSPR